MESYGGEHCASCSNFDFLPFICPQCNKNYCLDHRSHDCLPIKPVIPTGLPSNKCTRCKQLSVTTCKLCCEKVCAAHRHRDSHKCSPRSTSPEQLKSTLPKQLRSRSKSPELRVRRPDPLRSKPAPASQAQPAPAPAPQAQPARAAPASAAPAPGRKEVNGEMLEMPEVKVFLFGDAGAGKTALLRALLGAPHVKQYVPTHSADIYRVAMNQDCGWKPKYNLKEDAPYRLILISGTSAIAKILKAWPAKLTFGQYVNGIGIPDVYWPDIQEQRRCNDPTRTYETKGDELVGNKLYAKIMEFSYPLAVIQNRIVEANPKPHNFCFWERKQKLVVQWELFVTVFNLLAARLK